MTLYQEMAKEINSKFSEYKEMTHTEITKRLSSQFESNTNVATIHTLMQGIIATREYIKNTL